MMRAAVGSWVLILILTGLVVSSSLLGPSPTGTAVRQAPPTPPGVGTCVVGYQDPTPVPCDSDHTGQVVSAWTSEPPPARFSDLPTEGVPADDPWTTCEPAAAEFSGQTEELKLSEGIAWWRNSGVGRTLQLVDGPGPATVPGWSWTACTLVASDAQGNALTVDRSLEGSEGEGVELPSQWRICEPEARTWNPPVSCADPHRKEVIAGGYALLPEDVLAELQAQERQHVEAQQSASSDFAFPEFDLSLPLADEECRSLVEEALGGPLDPHAASLQVVVAASGLYFGESVTVDPTADTPVGAYLECSVHVIGDRPLVGSIRGIGSGPLPLE